MTTDITSHPLVHTVPGAAEIAVERDHVYVTAEGPLGFEIYRPHATGPCAAVVLVTGLPDPGVAKMLGKPLKDWASYMGWARLIAASGIAAITYVNRTPADVTDVLRHLREHAGALGLDPARIGVWACSGHVPNALNVIAREPLACAALLYGYLLDLDGATAVADAAKQFYFTLPTVTLDDLPRALPTLIVRAGQDATPGLDATLLRFVDSARTHSLAVTVIDHADAPHAFDLVDDSPRTHAVIDEILAFLRGALA